MKSFIQNIEDRIKKNIRIDKIEILDNTHKHIKHKSLKKNQFHLTLKMKTLLTLTDLSELNYKFQVLERSCQSNN